MTNNEEISRIATAYENIIKLELVTSKNRFKLAWYVLTKRALSVGYLINPQEYYVKD